MILSHNLFTPAFVDSLKMQSMKNSFLKALGLMMLCTPFVACDDDDDDLPSQAQVMVVHASPDAPNVDVRVNNAVVLSNVAFPSNSPYLGVNAGTANFKISPTGTTTYVIDASVDLEADKYYSVFAIDQVSKIKAAVVSDNLATPASGKAHVRFFHFSPNAPAVDIAVKNGPVVFANRTFNDQSTNASLATFTPLDAGTYDLEVRAAGTSIVVLNLPGVTVTAGKIYTVFAKGLVGGTEGKALGAQVITNN
jgi:hypothetical protein